MDSTGTKYISISKDCFLPIKKCWGLRKNIVVGIDKEIVNRLGITEDDTYVQQEITDDGSILLHLKHYGKEEKV